MAKFCLKLGLIDKKLIMIIITTIIYFIMDIIDYYSEMPSLPCFLDTFYTGAVGYIMIIIIPSIQKCRNKDLRFKEKSRSCKQIVLDLFYIYITYIIVWIVEIYSKSLKITDPKILKIIKCLIIKVYALKKQ